MTTASRIATRTIGDYLTALGSSAPTPGGGSVAGLIGALAAGLGQMVCNLSIRGSDADLDASFTEQRDRLGSLQQACLASSEQDERAYAGYIAATKLPKGTPEEKATRRAAMQQALHESAGAPLQLAADASELLTILEPIIAHANRHVLSDAEIAVSVAATAVETGLVNVRVNVAMIRDDGMVRTLNDRMQAIEEQTTVRVETCRAALAARRS